MVLGPGGSVSLVCMVAHPASAPTARRNPRRAPPRRAIRPLAMMRRTVEASAAPALADALGQQALFERGQGGGQHRAYADRKGGAGRAHRGSMILERVCPRYLQPEAN